MKQRNMNVPMELLIHGYNIVILAVTGFLLLAGEGSALDGVLYIAPCFTEAVRFVSEGKKVIKGRFYAIVNAIALIGTLIVLILGIISVAGYMNTSPLYYAMLIYPFREASLFAFYLVLALKDR